MAQSKSSSSTHLTLRVGTSGLDLTTEGEALGDLDETWALAATDGERMAVMIAGD